MATAVRVGDLTPAKVEQKRTDWLGKEYGPGDLVIYAPRSYGGGVNMHLAEVVRFTPKCVVVRPIASARHGKETASRTVLIDKRTGQRIVNNWRTNNSEHQARVQGYTDKEGKFLSYDEFYRTYPRPEVTFAPVIWKPYVLELKVQPPAVGLQVVKNVTKWEGEIPDSFLNEWEK